MENSFFGFDTSMPLDDDGGGRIAEPSEEEYDALNDETFGSAINGDWEEVHENLVRLDGELESDALDSTGNVASGGVGGRAGYGASMNVLRNSRQQRRSDSDLELNLTGMKLDDVDISYGESENMSTLLGDPMKMDPSVWSLHPAREHHNVNDVSGNMRMPPNPADFLREHFPSPFHKAPHHPPPPHPQHQHAEFQMMQAQQASHRQTPINMHPLGLHNLPPMQSQGGPPKICTLEDIERNLIMQQAAAKQEQTQQQQQQNSQQQQQDRNTPANDAAAVQQQRLLNETLKNTAKTPTPMQQNQQQQQQQQLTQQNQQLQQQIHQHQQQLTQQMNHQQHQQLLAQQQQQQKLQQKAQQQQQQQSPPRPSSNFANNLAQHPLGSLLQQQQQQQQHPQAAALNAAGNRINPGLFFPPAGPHPQLPPHPLLNQHGLPNNFPNQRPLPNPHLPVALNNFAMHPNFNAMRAAAVAAGIHPATLLAQQQQAVAAAVAANRIPGHPPNPMMLLNNQSSSNSSFNMFNMRLVQEIQQNHPLLQNSARQSQQQQMHQNSTGQNLQQHQLHQLRRGHTMGNINPMSLPGVNLRDLRRDATGNGNLPPEEYDEYANLMSTRDKHWLIGIQLSQLNTDTPYIDDYYYTVYKERKSVQNGSLRHSQAHKDNQLNHPLTQPKGHAQLILVQLGNKNGNRNGQQRERRNSDNHNNNQDLKLPMYVFTPLKFENSLGKLQYGSVTAPRKIIDAEIMSNESTNGTDNTDAGASTGTTVANNGSLTLSGGKRSETPQLPNTTGGELNSSNTQRKSRYILLHIETLYRVLLKLDDLNNPNAIQTILMKKKKESERIAAMEQLENANKTPEERAADPVSNPSLRSKFNYEIETKEALVEKLVAGLQHDKVVAMMNVRKGKVLIRRIMPYIEQHDARWNVWIGVFHSLQSVVKKDRDDAEGILYSLYPEFNKQIKSANFEIIVKISSAISLNDKKANGVFCSKFGISSLVCLILQAENIYDKNEDTTLTEQNKNSWRQFLDQVATSLNRTIQNQTICAAIESDSIQPIMNHFARFKDLKLDSLLALITEAKQQIN
ncbi:protein associated with topo II related - 1 [Musca autumnalis]|uniref:protein associated with topo II related - 1 n=1 Tax=Musca autumnalis TaxID=221902 RepID=UPI003CEE4932